jgi:hypothetical protein
VAAGLRFPAAFRQMAFIVPFGRSVLHGLFLDDDLGVGRDLQVDVGVAQLGDPADDAAGGDDLGALLEGRDHQLVVLGALHLRADQHEVQQHEHQDDGQEAHQPAGVGWGGGLRVCGADHGRLGRVFGGAELYRTKAGRPYFSAARRCRSAANRAACSASRPAAIASRSSRIRVR